MAGSVAKTVFKELLQINKKSLYNDTATCEPYDPDNPLKIKVVLTPQDGFYAGGSFEFMMDVPDNYPSKAPRVSCKTKIYHPNIRYGESGSFVCYVLQWVSLFVLDAATRAASA